MNDNIEITESYNREVRHQIPKFKKAIGDDYKLRETIHGDIGIYKKGIIPKFVSAVIGLNVIWVYKKEFYDEAIKIAKEAKIREVQKCW